MKRTKGDVWEIEQDRFRLQIRTTEGQREIEEKLPGWDCISYGYVPKTSEDIYVFERKFESKIDWTNFLNSDAAKEFIKTKEILND